MNYHNPHPPTRLPRVLSPEEVKSILDTTDGACDVYAPRDSAILHTLYSTGCRSAELCSMTTDRLDLTNNRIHIVGKFRRERWAFLSPAARRALDTWIALRHRWAGPHNYVWCNIPSGAPLADRVLRHIVSQRGTKALGTPIRVHPHMFRHSFATHLTDRGADLADLARLMGHASLDSTMVYMHTAPSRLASVHREFLPEEIAQ